MDNTESKTQQEGSKKNLLDELSREELISKCKSLLALAQKARQSKQDQQNELESYKIKHDEYEKENKKKDENIQTLQELVNSLTEQKLVYITDLESAKSKVKTLNHKISSLEDEIEKFKAEVLVKDKDHANLLIKLSNLDSENISLKRQNNRYVEENEQLLNQLSELEARTEEFNNLGLQQREQLKLLEEKLLSEEKFKATIEELNNKIVEYENKLEHSGEDNKYQEQLDQYENKIKEVTQLYENEKVHHEKSNVKLRSYKDKISKCAACINQLKSSRFILSKTVKEYSENIPKWQNDIITASVVLDGQIKKLSEENDSLKATFTQREFNLVAEIKLLRDQIQDLQTQNKAMADENALIRKDLETLNHQSDSTIFKELKNKTDGLEFKLAEVTNILQSHDDDVTKLIKKCDAETKLNEKYQLQIKALESEKSILVKEKLNAKDHVLDLEEQNRVLNSQLVKLQSESTNINSRLDNLVKENTILRSNIQSENQDQVDRLKCQIAALQEQNNLMKKDHENIADMNGLLKEEVETLKLSLEQPKDETDNLSEINISLQTDIVKLETKLAAYKQENLSLLTELNEVRPKLNKFDELSSEYEDVKLKLSAYKTENAELLTEMKEINQVLKERGESISKLQKAVEEMERLIETLEKDRDVSNQEKEHLRKTIDELECDLNNAKHKTTLENDTVHKLLAERDNANKCISDKERLVLSLRDEIEKLKQQSCAGDFTNEDMSTSTLSKAEEFARMRDLDETFEEKYTKLRIFALKLKKKLNETITQLQNTEKDKERLAKLLEETKASPVVSSDVVDHGHEQTTSQDMSDLQARVKSLSHAEESCKQAVIEIEVLRGEITNVNKRLSEEIEAHKLTKESLDKARKDVKKSNVLSLEMEDYEKSMKDLTNKMEENKKKIVQMESTIDTQKGTIASMKVQISLLEEQIKTEESQNRLVRDELQNAHDELHEKDNVIQVKNDVISKLELDLEGEKSKNEESNLEKIALLSEKEKHIINLGQEKTDLNNKLKKMEFKCSELFDQLNITNIELEDLKTEHTSYKVRAQAVLRQNQTVDHSQEERLKEEVAALKTRIETLTAKLESVQNECAEATEAGVAARRRVSDASAELARAQQRTARLHADISRLTHQLESERAHHKLQVTTLTQCYKTQMAETEEQLHKEINDLKNQLTLAQTSASNIPRAVLADENRQYVVPVIPKEDSDGEMDINVSMIPREEGEGSEWAPSPPPKGPAGGGSRSPVPLATLLEQGVPEDEPEGAADALSPDQEILDLRRKLAAQQQKVNHVTLLLSESERECARLTQLSELLKGELRRGRAPPGTQHNPEYMKNVTFKFLTLPTGDERSRLVPVLQKILSLTHEETNKIQAVARGLDPNTKGWGSYLPWSGPK